MKIKSYISIVIFIVGLMILLNNSFATGNVTNPKAEKTVVISEVAVTQLKGLIIDEQTGETIAGAEIF